jgi:hypothetical protein
MAYQFASTAILMLMAGGLTFVIQQSDRPGWGGAKIKFDTKRRLVVLTLVVLGILGALFVLIGQVSSASGAVCQPPDRNVSSPAAEHIGGLNGKRPDPDPIRTGHTGEAWPRESGGRACVSNSAIGLWPCLSVIVQSTTAHLG